MTTDNKIDSEKISENETRENQRLKQIDLIEQDLKSKTEPKNKDENKKENNNSLIKCLLMMIVMDRFFGCNRFY